MATRNPTTEPDMTEIILSLTMQVEACKRDIARNGDGFIGFYNRTRKSDALANLEHKLWVATMRANQ